MTLLIFGILWIAIGIAELCGWQGKLPYKFKDKPWTRRYLRSSGLSWVILGVLWVVLYVIEQYFGLGGLITILIGIAFAAPIIMYSIALEKKYTAMLGEPSDKKPGIGK